MIVRQFLRKIGLALPLLIFLLLAGMMVIGLQLDPRKVPSPLIGKVAPDFSLPRLGMPDTLFSLSSMRGQVWLLNVWASWCVSCVAEHPLLENFVQHNINIVGLNYKDQPSNAVHWLARHGDPYYVSAVDVYGSTGLDWGVYGVPETFLIDQQGVIRHKHIGPLSKSDIDDTILPQIWKLQNEH